MIEELKKINESILLIARAMTPETVTASAEQEVMSKERIKRILKALDESSIGHTLACPFLFGGKCHCGFIDLTIEMETMRRLAECQD